jgi:hypothetical protein
LSQALKITRLDRILKIAANQQDAMK